VVRRRSCAHPAALHSGTRLTRGRSSAAGVTRAQAWPLSLRRLAQSVNPSALPPRAVFGCSWGPGARRLWWSRGNSFRNFRNEFKMDRPDRNETRSFAVAVPGPAGRSAQMMIRHISRAHDH